MAERKAKTPESQETQKSEFVTKLEERWGLGNFVCVGLDSDYSKIPERFKGHLKRRDLALFNQEIVRATADLVCAYKPNIAFYEAEDEDGLQALKDTINFIHADYPEIPVILDAKRGDIGNTNTGYVRAAFDELRADAITVHPYLGKEALAPFLEREDKGIFVLARTSNPGAGEFQDLRVRASSIYSTHEKQQLGEDAIEQSINDLLGIVNGRTSDQSITLSEAVAWKVARHWNTKGNCGLVVGATYPNELRIIRELAGDVPILIPGIGAQSGDVENTISAGKNSRRQGMIINSSRGIIFASSGRDFAQAAREATEDLTRQINDFR